ncbi:general stress protein [Paenibacillus sp. L3-i20]|uniref:general stress protein n=1 Tax=Paenibacillus sp. L3-i20 TaxID=2905833 RepID=UPI001EE03AE9|nr:general stress protein [Paenibacillus sp. L3-i20]GKU76256.1 hypothetical protein L3i20_v206530 [Paenibacillus sp. L3-i20]
MAKKIGLFDSEQQVVDVINQLEQGGFTGGEIKVLTKDMSHSRRIESETDIHADEMHELANTYSSDGDDSYVGVGTTNMYGAANVVGGYGLASFGGSPAVGGIYSFGSSFPFLNFNELSAYRALGLEKDEAELCHSGVENGAVAVIVETDESKSLMDKDDGADLSRLSVAEGIFRTYGATRIADGK